MTDATLAVSPPPAGLPLEKGESPWRRNVAMFMESPTAVGALALLCVALLLALTAQWVTPQNPYDLAQLDIMDSTMPPGTVAGAGFTYWLGSDAQGRDMLSAIIFGLRISLMVAIVSTLIAASIGAALGVIAAYFGGKIDSIIMRIVDLQLSFPAILVALILLALFGRGIDKVIIALVTVQWAYYARAVRGSALVERQREYIEAARCLALPERRVIFGHLLPNCLPPLIVIATVQVAHAISLEATLSFLGVGVPVTEPSLGLLIKNGYDYLLSGKYWISTFPGVALVIVIVAINLVGDRLRDVLNPRLSH